LVCPRRWSAIVFSTADDDNKCSPPGNATNDFATELHYEALRDTLQQIDVIHSLVERYPDNLALARTSGEVWDAFRAQRVASLIGVEGLHQIANSASVMRNFHRLGVRYITLAHDSNNLYADSTVSMIINSSKQSQPLIYSF
jgi:membrane dipeptidase